MATEVKTMETKRQDQIATTSGERTKQATDRGWQISEFFGQTKAEYQKISWTSPDELRTYTKIVVGATFIFGMGIYFMDIAIQLVLNGLGMVMRLFGG